ncbi:plasma membrane calcium [Saitoella coloradoensis]
MADRIEPVGGSEPVRQTRQRAPTITIDTTNLAPAMEMSELNSAAASSQVPLLAPPIDGPFINAVPTIQDPTHLSPPASPTLAPGEGGFLAVPGKNSPPRSRSSSITQWEGSTFGGSSVSEQTAHNSPVQAQEKCHKSFTLEESRQLLVDPETPAEDSPFAFHAKQLGKLIDPKNLDVLRAMGGLEGLRRGLQTDLQGGLSVDEVNVGGRVGLEECMKLGASSDVPGDIGNAPAIVAAGNPQKSADDAPKRAPTVPHAEFEGGYLDRKRAFGINRLPEKKVKSIFALMWMALQDKILIMLSIAAVISLALGIYQTVGTPTEYIDGQPQAKVEWVEGVAIVVAILIVTVVGALNDYQKELQFKKLNAKKEDRQIKVIRSGKTVMISVYDLMVGDVVHLEPGDMIPVDGVFISGHNLKCDESAATGESDAIKKQGADDAIAQTNPGEAFSNKHDPYILSGSKVLEGVGTYVVTAVGPNSFHGKTMMALRQEAEDTPLQVKLNRVAEGIAKLGGSAALLLFTVLFIRFCVNLRGSTETADQKGQNFLQILIVAVTIVVVAVPEGLPLAVTLALAFATTRMLKDNNLVRLLRACETMGNATTICSDKTGTLTQNRMTVVAGTVGYTCRFGQKRQDVIEEQAGTADELAQEQKERSQTLKGFDDDALSMHMFSEQAPDSVKNLLRESIVINSTAFEGVDEHGEKGFVGSKTETALLGLARSFLGMGDVGEERANAQIAQLIPFGSERKCMGAVVKLPKGGYRMYVKGASEILLRQCTKIIQDPLTDNGSLTTCELNQEIEETLQETIMHYANRSLRTIGLVYRDFEQWPPKDARTAQDDPSQAEFADVFKDMTFICVVGIMDPLRPGVAQAVIDCQKAGVFVRMVTGDNVVTARAIATECGIYTAGGLVMEGPKFRALPQHVMDQVIPRLQVLARSSPEDKQLLVKRLKELGETVAVTGDGTNDGPALKMADVGFSMGIAGTEVAKEASAIILMDDNFASIVRAILWGRCVNDAVKKFLQFQLTVNITAVLLTFVSAVASSEGDSVLTAVQLLWVNLIMDTFAALALATDPPADEMLDRHPDPKSASLISFDMWKMIIGQAIYQLAVTYVLHFRGNQILGHQTGNRHQDRQMDTIVFNTFVWMQIFNMFNNRRLDRKLNIFTGIFKNWWFAAIAAIMIGGQVLIVYVGGAAFSVERITPGQWGLCIILGLISIPIGALVRLIPNDLLRKVLPLGLIARMERALGMGKNKNAFTSDNGSEVEWNPAIDSVRDELSVMKKLRGKKRLGGIGEKRSLRSFFGKHETDLPDEQQQMEQHTTPDAAGAMDHPGPYPTGGFSGRQRATRSRSNSAFSAAALVPSLIASSIGAGWTPAGERGESTKGYANVDVAKLEGVEQHPDTDPQNPMPWSVPPSPRPHSRSRSNSDISAPGPHHV